MGRMRFHNLCNFGITLPDNIYKVTYSNWGDDNFVSSPQFHISLDLRYFANETNLFEKRADIH